MDNKKEEKTNTPNASNEALVILKYLYKDLHTRHDILRFGLLKDMVRNLCEGMTFEELYTATNEEGKNGIYCRTTMGGKKFWDEEELTKLFVRKNKEKKRFRF